MWPEMTRVHARKAEEGFFAAETQLIFEGMQLMNALYTFEIVCLQGKMDHTQWKYKAKCYLVSGKTSGTQPLNSTRSVEVVMWLLLEWGSHSCSLWPSQGLRRLQGNIVPCIFTPPVPPTASEVLPPPPCSLKLTTLHTHSFTRLQHICVLWFFVFFALWRFHVHAVCCALQVARCALRVARCAFLLFCKKKEKQCCKRRSSAKRDGGGSGGRGAKN